MAGFQQGFAKTNPYVYQSILTCKKNKEINIFIGWLFKQVDTMQVLKNLKFFNIWYRVCKWKND